MSAPELYPIRTVASMTGVNAITLRAWERRHGLVRPIRTQSGHRLYRQSDVDTIHRIVALLDKGISIGQVSGTLSESSGGRAEGRGTDHWSAIRREMLEAIAQFDEYRLEDAYDGAQARFRDELVTQHVLKPLMTELGKRWESSVGSVAEEHFFSAYLRNKLGARFHHRARLSGGIRLMAACLPGEMHEAGLLLFCLAASEQGVLPVLLGADMPLDELPVAARRSRSEAIVLSGSGRVDPELFGAALQTLVVEAKVPVFLGGQCAQAHHLSIVAAGATPLAMDIEPAVRCVKDRIAVSAQGGTW